MVSKRERRFAETGKALWMDGQRVGGRDFAMMIFQV